MKLFNLFRRSVKPLASVQAFDPLCEVQSDKASVEITSPFDGVVKELLVQEGQVAKVGEGLCLIEVDEEILADADPATLEPVNTSDSPRETPARPPEKQDTTETSRRLHPLDPNFSPQTDSGQSEDVLATPSTRHFARQKGVDLDKLVPGSGKGGRIEKKDVEAFISRSAKPSSGLPQGDVIVELGRTRYGMWKAMEKVCNSDTTDSPA